MKAIITFEELSSYIRRNHHKDISFEYVSPDTVNVSIIQRIIVQVQVVVKVIIDKIVNPDIYLHYEGGLGINTIIAGFSIYLKEKGLNAHLVIDSSSKGII